MGRSSRKNTPTRLPSPACKYTMPRRPADSVPQCHANVAFLQHALDGGKLRSDLQRNELAHYLVGEGKGDDGSLPPMFTREDSSPSDAFASAWLRRDKSVDGARPGFDGKRWPLHQAWCADILCRDMPGELRHFRLMASPESHVGSSVDMQRFARELMQRVDDDLRRVTFWTASAHYNTDNPHVHIGVRGVDANGREVYFPGPYADRGFEYRARQVLGALMAEQANPGKQVLRAG